MSNDFRIWLNQTIWVSNTEKAKRHTYIPAFAEHITEYMKKYGYTMDRRWRKGEMAIARWLYSIHVIHHQRFVSDKKLTYPVIVHRNWIEDYDQFYHIIGFNEIQECMKVWRFNEDLDIDTSLGNATLMEFQQFIWCYIDLERSKQGMIILDYLDDTDSDSDSVSYKRPDKYIQDASEGYHGGGWAKV